MNYRELEQLYRAERTLLDEQLELNPQALPPLDRHDHDWWHLRNTFAGHRLGVAIGYLLAGVALFVARAQWHDPWIGLPMLVGAVTLLVNGYYHPAQTIPDRALEQYTTRELAARIVAFRHYANRRFAFDVLALLPFLFGGLGYVYKVRFGFHPIRDYQWTTGADVLLIGGTFLGLLLAAGLLQYVSDRKVGRVLARLASYLEGQDEVA